MNLTPRFEKLFAFAKQNMKMLVVITFFVLMSTASATSLGRSESFHTSNATDFRSNQPKQITPAIVQFPLSSVQLTKGSMYEVAQTRNLEFQLSLNTSQLLCEFTSAANLTSCIKTNGDGCATPGKSSMPLCNPLPGEMGPGGYYGHYLGHYLSGNAMMYNNTQDERILVKGRSIVDGLRKVADAWTASKVPNSKGYIFPYYPDVFGIMETRCGMPGPVVDYTVPYYTLHKIMAGLLDQAELAHNADARVLVIGLADWTVARVAQTLQRGGEALWQCVLGTEWGGMNEVMYNLYAITGTEAYLRTAELFNHWQWTAPLAIGLDDLDGSHGNTGGNHANTHIPEIIGAARGYELTANATQHAIAVNFFSLVTQHHSWATGGSNDGEHWGAPDRMGDYLNADTEESCTQYNILKVARHLFEWTGDSHLGDFYERAILNGILGNQNKEDPTMTSFIYMLPLGAGGMRKPWGKSNEGFPCCWGTLTEQFSKMADSIFFTDPAQTTLVVQQFVSATVHWAARNVTVTQEAAFPVSTVRTTTVTVAPAVPSAFTVKIRVPAWADGANVVTVNGAPVDGVQRGTFLTITRTWSRGDSVECYFPLSLWASPVQDTRPEYNSTVAYMYGPLVLAGLSPSTVFHPPPHCSIMQPSTFIARNHTVQSSLAFTAQGTGDLGSNMTMSMLPLFTIMDEAYTVYFRTQLDTPVTYAVGGASVPSATNADWSFTSASIVPSHLPTVSDIRTSGPHCTSRMTLAHPIEGQGHSIASVSFSFQYVAGYDAANGTWPVLSAELIDASTAAPVKALWQSSPLSKYQYDDFKGYSPPEHVTTTGNLEVPNSDALFLSFTVVNGDHNLQIPLDTSPHGLNITIRWNPAPDRSTHQQWFTHRQQGSNRKRNSGMP
eukprot:m.912521 g.912521  ORF g.912521 m.912521 type:complete len:893 (+) comp23727_c0_seq18:76-2754(+)